MRVAIARIAVILGCVLAPVSVLAVWVNNEVTNTGRYVANVAPLAEDEAVQAAITARVTDSIMNALEAQAMDTKVGKALSDSGLPKELMPAVDKGIKDLVRKTVASVIGSKAFQEAWVEANRVVHQAIVKVLTGQGDAVGFVSGMAVFDLDGVVQAVEQKLADAGFELAGSLPELHPTFQLFDPSLLVEAQNLYRWLDLLGWIIPSLSIGLIVLAIALAVDRRRMLTGAAIGLAVAMVVLAIVLAALRSIYLHDLPESVSREAASAVFDTLLRFVREGLRVILVVAMIVAGIGLYFGMRRQPAESV